MTFSGDDVIISGDDINGGDDVDGNDVSSGGEVCTDHSGERFWQPHAVQHSCCQRLSWGRQWQPSSLWEEQLYHPGPGMISLAVWL